MFFEVFIATAANRISRGARGTTGRVTATESEMEVISLSPLPITQRTTVPRARERKLRTSAE